MPSTVRIVSSLPSQALRRRRSREGERRDQEPSEAAAAVARDAAGEGTTPGTLSSGSTRAGGTLRASGVPGTQRPVGAASFSRGARGSAVAAGGAGPALANETVTRLAGFTAVAARSDATAVAAGLVRQRSRRRRVQAGGVAAFAADAASARRAIRVFVASADVLDDVGHAVAVSIRGTQRIRVPTFRSSP